MEYQYDNYVWTDNHKILTAEYLIIPGMEMFGHNRVAKKTAILAPHIHKTTEFVYLVNGSQKYYIEDKEYTVKGNQVFITDENTLHSTGEVPHGRYEILWFRLDIKEFANSLSVTDEIKELIFSRLHGMNIPIISLKENLCSLLQSSFYCLASSEPVQQLRGYAMFVDFITRLVKYTTPEDIYSMIILKATEYIKEKINTQITLDELADICGLSLSGFKQKFKRETGISPREYINITKIEKAAELLDSGMGVTETAFALDFTSSSYFSVLFKQMKGVSPGEYRKKRN